MKVFKIPHRCILILVVLLMTMPNAYPQTEKQIDSLKKKLVEFESYKSRLGSKVPELIDTVKIDMLNQLSAKYFKTNPNEVLPYIQEELLLSKKINFKKGIANSNNALGAYYDYKTNYPLALDYYKEALKWKIESKDEIGQIDLYNNIGVAYTKVASYPMAMEYLFKGLAISERIKDLFGIFGTYNNIGVLYQQQKNYTAALQNYFRCLSLQKKMKDKNFISVTYQNIGDVYNIQNFPDKAIIYFNLGLEAADKVGDLVSKANNIEGIGKVSEQKKDYQMALSSYLLALDIRKKMEDPLGIATSVISIGYVYLKQGNIKKAVTYLEDGFEKAKKTGELDTMRSASKYLSEAYAADKNYAQAYEKNKFYTQINDSIFNNERQKKITELQMEYNFKRIQDAAKTRQDKKDLIAGKQLENQKDIRNYTFFAMFMIVVFAAILLWQRSKIAKIRRQKALEEERNRISRDLHDNLGAQLSTVRMFMSSLKNNEKDSAISETVDNSITMLDASIHELRGIMNEMHHPVLTENGYLVATEKLINQVNQLHGVQFSLTHYKMEERPNPEIEHQLYRITQELVNNTLKYAKAKQVSIDILRRDGKLVLMYEDDGIGYEIGKIKKGYGFNNIETRIKMIGGLVEFDSMPNAGARTIIEIPE